ncbi:MAG TPA: 2-dehydropantoate 2-reductase [Terriglobales bacterium]|nr:2-dehydropantoate 2-reductase [Terriglobales bacterium]
MRHGIIGAGGVGGTIGAILAKSGESVTLIVRPGTARNYPQQLTLESTFGTVSGPVSVSESLTEAVDVLWITVKATQFTESIAGIPRGRVAQAVVPLLNGVDHIAILRSHFGHDRVIPATIAGEMERIVPGKVVHPSPFLRLNISSSGKPVLQGTVDEFTRFGMECKFFDNEATLLWGKLVMLGPFALSTTAAGGTIGTVLSDPRRRELMEECVREACAAANAAGAGLDPAVTIRLLGNAPPTMRSSMQKDVDAGRPPELDAIAGPILRGAEARGDSAPATAELVQQIERRMHAGIQA